LDALYFHHEHGLLLSVDLSELGLGFACRGRGPQATHQEFSQGFLSVFVSFASVEPGQ